MMGYLFAFGAVLCGVTKGFCGKKISGDTKDLRQAALYNLIRMVLCVLIGLLLVLLQGASLQIPPHGLLLSAVTGVVTAASVVFWLMAARRNAYMLVDVFCTLGVVIPLFSSAVWFDEKLTWVDTAGLALLFAAVWVISTYNSKVKYKLQLSDLGILLLVCVTQGGISLCQKIFAQNTQGVSPVTYQFYTYLFSAAALLVYLLYSGGKAGVQKVPGRVLWPVTVMAACLFGNSLLNTLAATHLTAAQLYPLAQGATLILSAMMAAVFFREPLKPRLLLGMGLCFAGLVFLNLL